ncbi:MAG: TIGR03960 family B12-binding radical SAM protein [Desulfovibrio sp.]|jgi:radical SAM family uncharacterized protein/radical SAM-linked protein|nr:TIGR03960 family B12-binding radical SAM protein [Desulfovibrio sp.]
MRELLPLLPKPSRYLGIEEGSVHKPRHEVRLRLGLVFPDMYEVGMSYLGQKILYSIVNARPHWQAERVFAPCREAGEILRARGAPLCTLESDIPLNRLDALGFSVTHELCYTNILYILDLAGIPLRAETRRFPGPDGRPWPLILAGGGCSMAAEPLAPFMDAMILGEAEASLPEVLETLERARREGRGRHDLLLALSRIPGLYIPEFFAPDGDGVLRPLHEHHRRIVRRIVPDMNEAPYPVLQPIPFGAVHNRLALEIGRGCTRGCRFCQAGSIYRPARERSVATLQKLLDDCLNSTGFDDLSYLSLSTGDFSALRELFMKTAPRCEREQVAVSLPSLRVGSLDGAIMARMAELRRTGATLAPEAGSQRLRDVINKGINEAELIAHARALCEHGWQQVKLYFMLGLPTERDEDVLAIADLCRAVRNAAPAKNARLQVTAAVSPFVPKAHTPFQWEAQIPPEELRRRVNLLLTAVKKEKGVTLRWREPDMSLLEGLFSRGDRRLADVVESAFRQGALFTSWHDECRLEPWLNALAEHGLRLEDYTRERGMRDPLPWDHLHSGLSREFFARERDNSLRGKTLDDCRYGACHACGVCDTLRAASNLESLPDMPADARYGNRLNKSRRDQDPCGPLADPEDTGGGDVPMDDLKIACGDTAEGRNDAERTKSATGRQARKKPPAIDPRLAVKAAKWRILYSRRDAAAYLSQLEIQRVFDRALRRARLPLSFSQGFHPLPLVSFGRALPVGVISECEWFCVLLREKRRPEEAIDALNAGLPGGVRILAIENVPLQASCADPLREHYRTQWLGDVAKREEFSLAWRRVGESPALPWRREGKKGPRELDAKAFFADIRHVAPGSCDLLMDWSGGYVSPLALCLHALDSVGHRDAPHLLRLTKLA